VPAALVADDVKRDYEAQWWKACREGDFEVVERMLRGGGEALAAARDDDGRSALHYACGVGSEECVRAIIARGAEVDAKDKDSFTPLHIAAGYLHEKIVETLVRGGANPELEDSTGRSPLDLVETLTINTPATTVTFARRSVLESIARTLEQFVFEEVPPAAIKRVRAADDGSGEKEYLVEWLDAFGDQWVPRRDVADDLVRDFENGLEYATVARAYEPPSRQAGAKKNRRRLVAWADGAPPTWEP
jgi:signal recognition particle protein